MTSFDTSTSLAYIEGRLKKMKDAMDKQKWEDASQYARAVANELEFLGTKTHG